MSTSGSIDFSQTTTEIIKDALLLVNAVEDEETPSDSHIAITKRALNRLAKAWMKRGLKSWLQQEGELYLANGQTSYTIGASGDLDIDRPLDIYAARWVSGDEETPVLPFSRTEYFNQVNKTIEGKPVRYYYDPQLTQGVLYLWPTPDDSQDTLKFSYRTPVEDFDSVSNDPHFPQEWLHALVLNLATQVFHLGAVDAQRRMEIRTEAMQALMDAEFHDNDDSSVYLVPEYR